MARAGRFLGLAILLFLLLGSIARAGTPNLIYVRNDASSKIPQSQVDTALVAFQIAISRDLAPVWGVDATLTSDPTLASKADMQVNLLDFSPVYGALGYHEVYANKPTAYVFTGDAKAAGEAWPLIFSHEVQEMLVDPWIDRISQDPLSGMLWAVEISDPVESGYYAYFINGIPISDFVTPNWFGVRQGGPYDFRHALKKAHSLGRHGYKQYFDFKTLRWVAVFA